MRAILPIDTFLYAYPWYTTKIHKQLKDGFGGTGILACVILEYRFKPHRQECLCHRLINFVVY